MDFLKKYNQSLKELKDKRSSRKKNLSKNINDKPYLSWRKKYCEVCGRVEDERILQVHHLNPLLKGTDRDNPSNCVTLCFNHHALAEYGKYPKWSDRREFEKWLIAKKETEFKEKI